MPHPGSQRGFTRGGDPSYAVVAPDLTQTDLELIRSCEPFSQRNRPDCRMLAMGTGSEFDGYDVGYNVTNGNSPCVIQHPQVIWPEFERGGWIEHVMIGSYTDTVGAGTIQVTYRENNIVADVANKLLDHAARAGPALAFNNLFAATSPSITSDPAATLVRLVTRIYSCGRSAQQWLTEWSTIRGSTFTGPAIIGGGAIAMSVDPEDGDREMQIRVSLSHANATWLVRNSTVMQFGIRHDGA